MSHFWIIYIYIYICTHGQKYKPTIKNEEKEIILSNSPLEIFLRASNSESHLDRLNWISFRPIKQLFAIP